MSLSFRFKWPGSRKRTPSPTPPSLETQQLQRLGSPLSIFPGFTFDEQVRLTYLPKGSEYNVLDDTGKPVLRIKKKRSFFGKTSLQFFDTYGKLLIQLRYKRITEKFDITGEGDGTPPIEDLKIRRFSKATGVELEAVVTVGGVERTLFISNTPHKSHNDEAVVLENGNILAMAERKEHYETDYIVAPGVDLVVITILCYMVDDAEMSDEDDERRRRESF